MKTSEMIAMLEENPQLRFKRIEDGKLLIRRNDILVWEFKDGTTELSVNILNKNWQLVRDPVTWQEALQAWLDGKEIEICGCAGCESIEDHKCHHADKQIIDSFASRLCRQQFKTAKWYINQ